MLLDSTGVPHSQAQVGSKLRVKCAAAAWAAEKRRSAANVCALDSCTQARLPDAFEVPTAWRPYARIQAAATVLLGCRDSAWALDPTTSFGLVHPARSALFRLQEGLAGGGTHDSADTCRFLPPSEQADLACILVMQGYCPGSQGVWSLGRGCGVPAPVPGAASAAAQLQVENEIRTLYIHPYAQLTASERKDQAARMNALQEKRKSPSYPGDPNTDTVDSGSNPFAHWLWDQSLLP